MTLTVYIERRDVIAVSRLLECLTRAWCLNERITWKEEGYQVILQIKDATEDDLQVFQSKLGYIVRAD